MFCIYAEKSIPTTRYDAVGDHFDGLEGAILGTNVARVDDVIASDGDLHAVFVFLIGFELADNLGVGELFAVVGKDISVTYAVEDVGAFYTL